MGRVVAILHKKYTWISVGLTAIGLLYTQLGHFEDSLTKPLLRLVDSEHRLSKSARR